MQQCSWAYGDGRRGWRGGGRWHTLLSSSALHDSLLKENRHFMQPSQALINKSLWVAVYPAFFINAINVYQTVGVPQSSCLLWSSTSTPLCHGNLQQWHRVDEWAQPQQHKAEHCPRFRSLTWTSGREKSHPQHWGCSYCGTNRTHVHMLRNVEHVTAWQPEAFLFKHTLLCRHAHGPNINWTNDSMSLWTHAKVESRKQWDC